MDRAGVSGAVSAKAGQCCIAGKALVSGAARESAGPRPFASVSAALAGTFAVTREAVVSGPATTPPVRGRARLAALTGRRRCAIPRDLHRLAGTGHVPLA